MVLCVGGDDERTLPTIAIRCMAFSENGLRLAIGGDFGARVFALPDDDLSAPLEVLTPLSHALAKVPVWTLALDANGRSLASAGAPDFKTALSRATVTNVLTGDTEFDISTEGSLLRISFAGDHLVITCEYGGHSRVEIHPLAPGPPPHVLASATGSPLYTFISSPYSRDAVILFAAPEITSTPPMRVMEEGIAKVAIRYCAALYTGSPLRPAYLGVLGVVFLRGGLLRDPPPRSPGLLGSMLGTFFGGVRAVRNSDAAYVLMAAHRHPLSAIAGLAAGSAIKSHLAATASRLGTLIRVWDIENMTKLCELRVGFVPMPVSQLTFQTMIQASGRSGSEPKSIVYIGAVVSNREIHAWRCRLSAETVGGGPEDDPSEPFQMYKDQTVTKTAAILGGIIRHALPFDLEAPAPDVIFRFEDLNASREEEPDEEMTHGDWVRVGSPTDRVPSGPGARSKLSFAFASQAHYIGAPTPINSMTAFAVSFSDDRCEWQVADFQRQSDFAVGQTGGVFQIDWSDTHTPTTAKERIDAFCVSYCDSYVDP